MATLRSEAMRLPACVALDRAAVLRAPAAAARAAVQQLEAIRGHNRRTWSACSASGSVAWANRHGLRRGVLKMGWSWEAKLVWFWRGEAQLAQCLRGIFELPGWRRRVRGDTVRRVRGDTVRRVKEGLRLLGSSLMSAPLSPPLRVSTVRLLGSRQPCACHWADGGDPRRAVADACCGHG